MTETVLRDIVQRAVRDGAFRAQLRQDPAKALAGFGLTAEERSAITTGDPARLAALGVDQRTSKMFNAGLLGESSKVVIGDPQISAGDTFVGDETTGSAAIIGDPAAPAVSAAVDPSWSATHLRMVEGDLDSGAVPSVEAGLGGQHLRMVEQDLDTAGAAPKFLTEDEELLASRSSAEASGATPSHLQMLEQDLDTGAAFEAQVDSAGAQHLRSIEADLDTGGTPANVDGVIVDQAPSVEITGGETPTDY